MKCIPSNRWYMLLASSKYGKHHLAFKPIRKGRIYFGWIINQGVAVQNQSYHIFPQENLSEYLKIMVLNIAEHGNYSSGADPGIFLGGGALFSCSTSTPINHIVWQNTSCIRKPQVISGGAVRTPCTLPLDPPLFFRAQNVWPMQQTNLAWREC